MKDKPVRPPAEEVDDDALDVAGEEELTAEATAEVAAEVPATALEGA